MQAKRRKKFQKQAWCATLQGTKQWISRVRAFSSSAIHIDEILLDQLIEFIDLRVVPVLNHWSVIANELNLRWWQNKTIVNSEKNAHNHGCMGIAEYLCIVSANCSKSMEKDGMELLDHLRAIR
jgi:4-alpha-glucanotransferase